MPRVSIAIPIHNMDRSAHFLARLMAFLEMQTYKDYEIVISQEEGTMAQNTNAAIKKCKGDIIKILYMDDYLYGMNSLQKMVDSFNGGWLATGCLHDDGTKLFNEHKPSYNDKIYTGNNTIGSPSVIMIENKDPLLFDEKLNWVLDCDYYKRLHDRYGPPTLIEEHLVVLGIGEHQTTHKLSNETKEEEVKYLISKYQ